MGPGIRRDDSGVLPLPFGRLLAALLRRDARSLLRGRLFADFFEAFLAAFFERVAAGVLAALRADFFGGDFFTLALCFAAFFATRRFFRAGRAATGGTSSGS